MKITKPVQYQKHYEGKIGKASLDINKAIAGSDIDCKLTYTVGDLGIDDSGSIKILFRIVTDAANPQFEDSHQPNYVKITTSNKKIKIIPGLRSGGLIGKVYERPWSKGFTINFLGDHLSKGDNICFNFKNWRVQTFCEKTFEFKILVDPFATGRYVELPKSPEIQIIPDQPERLVLIAPTKVGVNTPFNILAKLEDMWGNPCTNVDGEIAVEEKDHLPKNKRGHKLEGGISNLKFICKKEGTVYLTAKYLKLTAISNPIRVVKKPKINHFWADLHGQSEETVGTNDIYDYFNFARNYAFLDVASHQGNDFQITDSVWKKINNATKTVSKTGGFIALPGYEWSGNTSNGGDRNVIYENENTPIYRSSHALIDNFNDIKNDAPTARDLFRKLKNHKALVIAHVGGRFADMSTHDDNIERLVEVHSDWGTFDWIVFDSLKRGYKVGIVANSDGHTGRPGASYPSFAHFNSYGGLTCILSTKLTRKDIFSALRKRHTYATTGIRAYLNVEHANSHKVFATMGDKSKYNKDSYLAVDYSGTAPIERLQIFNKDKIIHTHIPEIKNNRKKVIKIVMSGSKVKGRDRKFNWDGKVEVKKNKIIKLEKINFYNQSNIVKNDQKTINWNGDTTGDSQALILYLKSNTGTLDMTINNKYFILNIAEVTGVRKTYSMGGLDAKVEVFQTHHNNKPGNQKLTYKLDSLTKGVNPLFVKITQRDEHKVWSSPIYISK